MTTLTEWSRSEVYKLENDLQRAAENRQICRGVGVAVGQWVQKGTGVAVGQWLSKGTGLAVGQWVQKGTGVAAGQLEWA